MLRGIRGATTVDHNTQEDILDRTCELLKVIIERNSIEKKAFETPLFFAEGKRMERMEKSQKGQTKEIMLRMALRQEEERSFGRKKRRRGSSKLTRGLK